jgi:hypothetical protein
MPQILSDNLLSMVQSFLSAEAANSFRGAAPRFIAATIVTAAERLLEMTRRLNAARTSGRMQQALYLQARHMIAMRRRREHEDGDFDSDPEEEERTCMVCGRLGGQGNFYNLVAGGVMCDVCMDEEEVRPAVDSFF